MRAPETKSGSGHPDLDSFTCVRLIVSLSLPAFAAASHMLLCVFVFMCQCCNHVFDFFFFLLL